MTNLLLKLFVKEHKNTGIPAVREAYGVLSGKIGILFNILLFALKLFVGLAAGSIAVIADAFNNLSDSANSVITLLGFKLYNKPSDKEHPFGHWRVEEVVSLIIAASILMLGYEFARNSIEHILEPRPIEYSVPAVVLLAVGLVVKFWLFVFNGKLGKLIDSGTLKAISIDALGDCFIGAATIFSLVITMATGLIIDGIVGLLVAAVLLRNGFIIAKDALSTVIGKPADKRTADTIKELVLAQDGIIGVHDLVVHYYGRGYSLATIHAEVPMDVHVGVSHRNIEAAEMAVKEQLGIHLVIHMDPVDLEDTRLQALIGAVKSFLAQNYPKHYPHDFRMAESLLGDKFIFDLEIPYGYTWHARTKMLEELEAEVARTDAQVVCIINTEHGYIAEE